MMIAWFFKILIDDVLNIERTRSSIYVNVFKLEIYDIVCHKRFQYILSHEKTIHKLGYLLTEFWMFRVIC